MTMAKAASAGILLAGDPADAAQAIIGSSSLAIRGRLSNRLVAGY
ncbi:MAG: hypothetical protein OXL97_11430 [Chloroflexota bacterium]|nr:hypothetical protein [Chloroflexota bacterium]MDE2883513.1 hypothetical protein [Chloroflexota bacterium]